MKKIGSWFVVGLILLSTLVWAAPVTKISIIGSNPIYSQGNFAPLLFLNSIGGRVLRDDSYGPFNNGNLTTRNGNYIFTGELIQWTILVWDTNGIERMGDTFAGWAPQTNGPTDPQTYVNCAKGPQLTNGANLAAAGYGNVRAPGDTAAQTTFNSRTMSIFTCSMVIPPICSGPQWFTAKTIDLDGGTGTMKEAEAWFCNPSVDLTVSGAINFGILLPGQQGSSTFSIKNNPQNGSGVEVILLISGKDFYNPSPSSGVCPTSNVLKLQGDGTAFTTGFWYTATQGLNSVGKKRIPYGLDITKADPIFSSGNGMVASYSPLVPTSAGSEVSMTLHLGLPQPCNGVFTNGQIYLHAIPI